MILLTDKEISDLLDEGLNLPIEVIIFGQDVAKAQAEKAVKESLDKAENFLDTILDCYIPGPTLSHPHDLGGLVREDWQKLRKEIEE